MNIQFTSPLEKTERIEKEPPKLRFSEKLLLLIKKVLKVFLHAGLFLVNPTFYAVAFVAGLIWPNELQAKIEKIENVWKKQPWTVMAILGTGAYLAIQVTGAAASIYCAARFGISLAKSETI